jgi:glycosyltransferase involved in cell wall biosynthesis
MARSPRVLILTAYYFPFQGGVETHARAIARDLHAHDIPVVIVTRRRDDSATAEETIDEVRVYRVPPGGPRTGLRKWLMIPFAFRQILRLASEFDVIYCAGYQGIGLAALAAGAWLRRPVVLRSGNLGVLSGWNWNAPLERLKLSPNSALVSWLKARVRRVYMRADAFVANCREIETEALDVGVPRSHVHYLPNAVDIERFRPPRSGERDAIRAELGWPLDAMVCLYVGRLSAEKGVRELLDAWRELRPVGWRLIFVGPDMTGSTMDAGPEARAYVTANNLDSVTFQGASTDAAPVYRAADLYVLPSHYEAFSNSLIEAMGTGLPVVATRVGGNLDAIVEDENGLLATPQDSRDLAAQLARAMSDATLRTRLGTNARATVVANFNAATVFGRFRALFARYVPTGK